MGQYHAPSTLNLPPSITLIPPTHLLASCLPHDNTRRQDVRTFVRHTTHHAHCSPEGGDTLLGWMHVQIRAARKGNGTAIKVTSLWSRVLLSQIGHLKFECSDLCAYVQYVHCSCCKMDCNTYPTCTATLSLCGLRYIVKENMQNKLYNRSPFIKYVCTNLKLQEHKM